MATLTQLATGLAGAIGSDFRQTRSQLDFVEFGGKVSRINLIPTATVVSSGTATLHGTWLFDLDAGVETNNFATADVWWEQIELDTASHGSQEHRADRQYRRRRVCLDRRSRIAGPYLQHDTHHRQQRIRATSLW